MPSAIKPSLGIINLDLPSFIGTFNSILLFGKLNSIGRDLGNLIFKNLDPVFIFSDAIIALILEFKILPSIIICTGYSGYNFEAKSDLKDVSISLFVGSKIEPIFTPLFKTEPNLTSNLIRLPFIGDLITVLFKSSLLDKRR